MFYMDNGLRLSFIFTNYSPKVKWTLVNIYRDEVEVNIKPLMTGPKGNSEFCFPETLKVPPRQGGREHWGQISWTWNDVFRMNENFNQHISPMFTCRDGKDGERGNQAQKCYIHRLAWWI